MVKLQFKMQQELKIKDQDTKYKGEGYSFTMCNDDWLYFHEILSYAARSFFIRKSRVHLMNLYFKLDRQQRIGRISNIFRRRGREHGTSGLFK